MKQTQSLSSIFASAARALGFLPKEDAPQFQPQKSPQGRNQKQRSQAAFSAMKKMEIQREFEIQKGLPHQSMPKPPSAPPPPSSEALEAGRDFKPIKTVRFKKPGSNA